MNVVFRTDASYQIGTGHVMRCLTLADALRSLGAKCRFICRSHAGNMLELIAQRGYAVSVLKQSTTTAPSTDQANFANWLGADWRKDAEQSLRAIGDAPVDWIIVDHYAIDSRWEKILNSRCKRLLVIDDLANRSHVCNVLIDQNLNENLNTRYDGKVPQGCVCLLGPKYAILRPEFSKHRQHSLDRRIKPKLENLLIFLGGSDPNNETTKVVQGVIAAKRKWKSIDIVIGAEFQFGSILTDHLKLINSSRLHVQTSEMAKLMTRSDFAITAGGSVTWEKCVLGLPSLVTVQGENEYPLAIKMNELKAQKTIGIYEKITIECYATEIDSIQSNSMIEMSKVAQELCDGHGADLVVKKIFLGDLN